MRLHLALHLDVEYLQRLSGCNHEVWNSVRRTVRFRQMRLRFKELTFQSYHPRRRVHNCGVGRDGSPCWVARVGQVDDHHLRLFSHLLAHADEFI